MAESGGLLNRCSSKDYHRFESCRLRHFDLVSPGYQIIRFDSCFHFRCRQPGRGTRGFHNEQVLMDEKTIEAKDAIAIYENGKSRRYGLLFAVNGGAIALAKVIDEHGPVGWLTVAMIAYGMIVFNLIMTIDIFSFGFWCRYRFKQDVFGPIGWTVLALIGYLLSAAWIFASQRYNTNGGEITIFLFGILIVGAGVIFAINDHIGRKFQDPEKKAAGPKI